jgi:colicin import membrane protein
MALATAICLAAPAFSQAANSNEQDAEVRFGIKLTAALNNDREAQFLVAQMYEQGAGTPQNLRMAHLWYTKSAKQGYAPAVEKLDNWEKARQESESLAQARAEQQKRRQAETEAAAKTAREEAAAKAARERAEEQKRRQAEAAAAATAKTAREEAAAKAARERAEEQKRRQAEAAAAATAAKAASEEAAKTAKASEPAPVVKDVQSGQPKDKPKEATAKSAEKSSEEFRANPCNTPTAKFTSICQ